jgi:lipopolysaccharide cholinephosphotransferase
MKKLELRELQLIQLDAFKEIHDICLKHSIKYFMIGGTLLGAIRHNGFIPWDDDLDIAMFRPDYDTFIELCKSELSDKYFLQNYKTDIDYYPALTRISINNTQVNDKYTKHLKCHKGTYIDVFPLDNVPDDITSRNKQKRMIASIDKIMFFKARIIYKEGPLRLKRIGKSILSFILIPIPLKWLQQKRVSFMIMFNTQKTKNVCSTASKYGYRKQVIPRDIYGEPVMINFENDMYYAPQKWEEYLKHLFGDYMKLPPKEQQVPMFEVYKAD